MNFRRNVRAHLSLFPILAKRRGQAAGTLSGGEQQCRHRPRHRLLAAASGCWTSRDGPRPDGRRPDLERIGELHRDGLTILLVEQRVAEAVQTCDFGYVLEAGRVVLEGTHQTLLADDRIRSVYLGSVKKPDVVEENDVAKIQWFISSMLALAVVIGAAGCLAPVSAQQPKEVEVALIAPLSGPWARQGQLERMGTEMAIDDIKSRAASSRSAGRK